MNQYLSSAITTKCNIEQVHLKIKAFIGNLCKINEAFNYSKTSADVQISHNSDPNSQF